MEFSHDIQNETVHVLKYEFIQVSISIVIDIIVKKWDNSLNAWN